ncbi:hypothetical protein [Burkholderia ubonensis]|uniref:hypothetical protein n=1 Tax=Burkholderia ubonensis TaxID=101571 RepID=UPI000AA66D72|nr:hypothetical protein [Burkholderia ubonensis]
MWEDVSVLLERFHGFDDGLLLSFTFAYEGDDPLKAKLIFYSRNHSVDGNVWSKVEIEIEDVQELFAKVNGAHSNAICSSVKLIRFGEVWCVDVDGNYIMAGYPKSMDEVRQFGECYVTGRNVRGRVIE